MNIKLALFDMDGTLFDTREPNFLSYEKACAEHGISIDRTFFLTECYGRNYRDFLPDLGVPAGLVEEIHDKKIVYYNDYLDRIAVNERLFSLIDCFRKSGIKTALVTTASKSNTLEILRVFDRAECFDLVMTQADCERQKPAPDCYLAAMEHFGAAPSESVIFEDAAVGITAAKASGAAVYKVESF